MTITKEKLAEWKALADGASKGPWRTCKNEANWESDIVSREGMIFIGQGFMEDSENNAQFAAASRTIVPELIAEVERLRQLLCDEACHQYVKIINKSTDHRSEAEFICEDCGKLLRRVIK